MDKSGKEKRDGQMKEVGCRYQHRTRAQSTQLRYSILATWLMQVIFSSLILSKSLIPFPFSFNH